MGSAHLDNFLFIDTGSGGVSLFWTLCFFMKKFGIPTSADKTEDPTSCLSFFGDSA